MIKIKEISCITWVPRDQQLANCIAKKGAATDSLLRVLFVGKLN